MTLALAILLCGLCGGLVGWGLLRRERLLQFPFLAAWAVALQILPQLYALKSSNLPYPPEALSQVILMVFLCLGMTAIGYFMPRRKVDPLKWRFDGHRLLLGATALVGIGQFFGFLIGRLPEEMTRAGPWSGTPVAYLFFVRLAPYGFAIALALFLRYRSTWAFLLLLPNTLSSLSLMVFYGRRTPTAEFFLALLCMLWFVWRWLPPRPVMIAGVLAFGIFVVNISDYRHAVIYEDEGRWQRVREIDYLGNLQPSSMVQDNAQEMLNALYYIDAVTKTRDFNYGLSLYNDLVDAYVPRQLVGERVKSSLRVPLSDPAFAVYGFEPSIGSCQTGVAEAFLSFWYFGSLIFLAFGYVMRRCWDGAMSGGLPAQVIYVSLVALYLGAYNGTIHNFTVPWIHLAVFLGPVLVWARVRQRSVSPVPQKRITAETRFPSTSTGTLANGFFPVTRSR